VLRSTAVIAEWLSEASGVGRTRVDWDILRDQKIPLLPEPKQRQIADLYRNAQTRRLEMLKMQADAKRELEVSISMERAPVID
jgi:restriction endonuclease S subunit